MREFVANQLQLPMIDVMAEHILYLSKNRKETIKTKLKIVCIFIVLYE